jgi:hypothetical protein
LTVFQESAGVGSVMPKSIIYPPFGIFAQVEGDGRRRRRTRERSGMRLNRAEMFCAASPPVTFPSCPRLRGSINRIWAAKNPRNAAWGFSGASSANSSSDTGGEFSCSAEFELFGSAMGIQSDCLHVFLDIDMHEMGAVVRIRPGIHHRQ